MKLQIHPIRLELVNPWKLARTEKTDSADVVVVELSCDEIVGYGEASPVRRYGETAESVRRFLTRLDLNHLRLPLHDSVDYNPKRSW